MTSAWLRHSRLTDFARSRSGATALEFGLLAFPFVLLMFAILEVAMIFWSSQALETAVANASRKVYTGQFQTDSANANKTAAQLQQAFKDELCANITALFSCSQVSVDVRNYSFVGGTAPSGISNGAYDPSGYSYQSVSGGQIALITASFEYQRIVKLLPGPGTLSNGNRLIMATATFRTEPYN